MANNNVLPATGETIRSTDRSAVKTQVVQLDIQDGAGAEAIANGVIPIGGQLSHDAVDTARPVKVGARAVDAAVSPTAVAAGDLTHLIANRVGMLFTIGGHPDTKTIRHTVITTAVTNAAIITVAAGTRITVTRITVTLDNASTVFPSVLIGFAAATTPTTTQVLASHGGVPAGGGFTIGDGSGILGLGVDDEDLRITTVGNATGNGLHVVVSYYLSTV